MVTVGVVTSPKLNEGMMPVSLLRPLTPPCKVANANMPHARAKMEKVAATIAQADGPRWMTTGAC